MYKIGFIGRYKAGVDRADGRAYWGGAHAALTAAVPGLEKYTLNFPIENLGMVGTNSDPTRFDGYACLWFADKAAFDAAVETPEWATVIADAAEFLDLDWSRDMSAVVEENVVIDGPEGPFKAVWICRFNDEIHPDKSKADDAHAYWKRTHGGAYGVKVPGIDRYVQNHTVAPLIGDLPEVDGFSECWFQDRASFDITMAAPEWDEMNADAFNLFEVKDFIVDGFSATIEEVRVKG